MKRRTLLPLAAAVCFGGGSDAGAGADDVRDTEE